MNRFVPLFLAIAMLAGSTAQAQQTTGGGRAAANSTSSSNSFAWGIGLGGLAVVGTVAGVVAATASSSQPSFNH